MASALPSPTPMRRKKKKGLKRGPPVLGSPQSNLGRKRLRTHRESSDSNPFSEALSGLDDARVSKQVGDACGDKATELRVAEEEKEEETEDDEDKGGVTEERINQVDEDGSATQDASGAFTVSAGYGDLHELCTPMPCANVAQMDAPQLCPSPPVRNFKVGDLVWAKSIMRKGCPWPARVVDPVSSAPNGLWKLPPPSRICVKFLGPPAGRGRDSDYSWVHVDDVLHFRSNHEQDVTAPDQWAERTLGRDLELAMAEADHEAWSMRKQLVQGPNSARCITRVSVDEAVWTARKRLKFVDDKGTQKHADINKAEGPCPVLPETVPVVCAGVEGAYVPRSHEVRCMCRSCKGRTIFSTISRWEAHTGCRSKKWKTSVKLLEDSSTTLLTWLEHMVSNGAVGLAFDAQTHDQRIRLQLQFPFKPVMVKWTPERCAVCGWVEDYDYNQMLVCNRCQIAVHEECYGARASEIGGSFICRNCESPGVERECCLCPVKGGALKPTVMPEFWVHISCAWFVKGMFFKDVGKMEPACGLAEVSSDLFKKKCVVCNQIHGACLSCEDCSTTYHATCALRAGYRMEISSVMDKDRNQVIKKVSYCAQHRKPKEDGRLVLPALEPELKTSDTELQTVAGATNTEEASASSSTSPFNRRALLPPSIPGNNVEAPIVSRCTVYSSDQHKNCRRKEAVAHITAGFSQHPLNDVAMLTKPPEPVELLSIEERLVYLEKTQKARICFGKSAIHKWGLFARRDIQEGEMVVEYRGEVVRRAVADLRERRYRLQGEDCYLFKVSEDMVIDATRKGNIARLINHSCSPNCYARIFPAKRPGGSCIILMTRKLVKAGEELTYDYQFDPENSNVPCLCGAPDCRKFIC